MPEPESAGFLHDDVPYLKVGQGPPLVAVQGLSAEHAFYSPELFRGTAEGVTDGRVHIFPGWGHGRASMSSATLHLTLGFMLGGVSSPSR
jgi:hypothetical protein